MALILSQLFESLLLFSTDFRSGMQEFLNAQLISSLSSSASLGSKFRCTSGRGKATELSTATIEITIAVETKLQEKEKYKIIEQVNDRGPTCYTKNMP